MPDDFLLLELLEGWEEEDPLPEEELAEPNEDADSEDAREDKEE